MGIIMIRTFILYLVVLFSLRLMGKSELSKMSTFQMVILFMIAELASIPIDSPNTSLLNGVVSIFTLLFLQVVFSFFSTKNEKFKTFINGKPSIIIDNGQINIKEMEKLRITINDLFEELRINDCPSPSDVKYAIMESNGELSVISKDEDASLPLILICDGHIYNENLNRLHVSTESFTNRIHSLKLNLSEIFLAYYDSNLKLHLYTKPSKSNKYAEEVKI